MSAPEFHLYLPQMRLGLDVMVEKAQAAEAAGFVGMAGMDHLAPPMAEQHDMYEAITTNAWLLAHTRTLVAGYKVPKEIHVLDVVQRTPAGKPDYRWAKARAAELSSSSKAGS